MVRSSSLIILILFLSSAARAFVTYGRFNHSLQFTSWNESVKTNVEGQDYTIKSQIFGVEYKLNLFRRNKSFDYSYFFALGAGKANSQSDQNFTFTQTGNNVTFGGVGFSIFHQRDDKIRFGFNTGLYDRLINYKKTDSGLTIYQKEKQFVQAGLDILYDLNDSLSIVEQVDITSEGKIKWSIGVLF